jgi:hypothetical protein
MAAELWSPSGFERYRGLYPATRPLRPEPDRTATGRFVRTWEASASGPPPGLRDRAAASTVVFVRGYLGHHMPGNLVAARDAARRIGFDSFIARNRAGGEVAANAAALGRELRSRRCRERLVFCAHSRAGVECLLLLSRDAELARRCDGVALSQTPHGPSLVMESLLLRRHRDRAFGRGRRLAEALQRFALGALGARPGGYELTSDVWPRRVAAVDGRAWPFPVLQTASWSVRPTAWLDSFHSRLAEIAPGQAHDGQFLLHDLIWPGLPHVLLPELDHAQPVLGGAGFDSARYWLALLAMLLDAVPPAGEGSG